MEQQVRAFVKECSLAAKVKEWTLYTGLSILLFFPVHLFKQTNKNLGYSWLLEKVPDAGKDWGQKEKRASEDEMAGWHHWCNGHELGQTLGDGEGQGGLACCSPWGHKELDSTGQLADNNSCFTMLCYFLLCSKVNHLYVYTYPLSLFFISPPFQSTQSTEQSSHYTAGSH